MAQQRVAVAGILLTGGASTRMGRDKASLEIEGTPLAVRIANILRDICVETIEVGPGSSGLRAVREDPPGAGPLVAVSAARRALASLGYSGPALVVACDLPFVTRGLLEFIAAWDSPHSVVPFVQGRAQPLCARWSEDDLARCETLVAAGERSLRHLSEGEGFVRLEEPQWRDVADERTFADVDSPQDLERLGISPSNFGAGQRGP